VATAKRRPAARACRSSRWSKDRACAPAHRDVTRENNERWGFQLCGLFPAFMASPDGLREFAWDSLVLLLLVHDGIRL
jgi:hypothetical protein